MERHVFKVSDNGEFSGDGFNYDCKCVSRAKALELIDSGWSYSIEIPEHDSEQDSEHDSEHEEIPEEGSDYEADLRAKIKALGGKAGGRSSIETLEKKLSELENGTGNN